MTEKTWPLKIEINKKPGTVGPGKRIGTAYRKTLNGKLRWDVFWNEGRLTFRERLPPGQEEAPVKPN
jgi:hypothetical protein